MNINNKKLTSYEVIDSDASTSWRPARSNDRFIRGFTVSWKDIPQFAIITGPNGSGKSYLLERIKNSLEKSHRENYPNGIQFTYISALDGIHGTEYAPFGTAHVHSNLEGFVFDRIKGLVISDMKVHNFVTSIVDRISRLVPIDELKKKSDVEIKQLVTEQCRVPTLGTDTAEINPSIFSIIDSAETAYNETLKSVCNNLKQPCSILDEPYSFWQEENPGLGINDYRIFLKDELKVDELIKRLAGKMVPQSDKVNRLNSLLPASFPYRLVKWYQEIFCYPRNMELNLDDEELRVQFNHLSSGEQAVLKVVSLVLYNHGLDGFIVNKPSIILLDEPDKHLDPKLCKIFFDAVYDILVKQENIQVIMTTHRVDTINLAPRDCLFKISRQANNHYDVHRTSSLEALFRMTGNIRQITNYHHKVYAESLNDVNFYEGVYNSLKAYCFQIREKAKREHDTPDYYWYINNEPFRIFSQRCQMSFFSASNEKNGGGGCTEVISCVKRDLNNILFGESQSAQQQQCLNSRWPFGMPWLSSSYGILDSDHGVTRNMLYSEVKDRRLADVLQKNIVFLPRHSLENFLLDPFVFYSALSDQELDDFVNNDERLDGDFIKNIKKYRFTVDQQDIEQKVAGYFQLFRNKLGEMAAKKKQQSDFLDSNDMTVKITIITSHDRYIAIDYPKFFLETRGHDIEYCLGRIGKKGESAAHKITRRIAENIYSNGLNNIPLDLAQVYFALNTKIINKIREIIGKVGPVKPPNNNQVESVPDGTVSRQIEQKSLNII